MERGRPSELETRCSVAAASRVAVGALFLSAGCAATAGNPEIEGTEKGSGGEAAMTSLQSGGGAATTSGGSRAFDGGAFGGSGFGGAFGGSPVGGFPPVGGNGFGANAFGGSAFGGSPVGGFPPAGGASTGGVEPGRPDAGPSPGCDPTACNGHGVCATGNQGAMCVCDEGFDAPSCSTRNADYGRRVKIAENLADPDVIKLSDDRYVLSGTGSGVDFEFLESSDLVTWNGVGTYDPSAVDPAHDYCFCWAPEIVQTGGALVLYFVAHRGPMGATACPPPSGSDVTTYRASSPDGSFHFGVPELLFQGQAGAQSRTQSGCPSSGCGLAIRIDPTVYDGRLYYVFFDRGNNVASVSMTNPSDLRVHAGPSRWTLDGYEEGINEAPELFERTGRSYLFFSAAWFDSQYATFYVMGGSPAVLSRDLPRHRLTTPARRGNGNLIETHGGNSVTTRRGETFNFFHVGVFDAGGGMVRRDAYRQRIVWNDDGSAVSQNQVQVSWNALGGGNEYSLDLVLRNGSVIGPCIAAPRIGQSTSTAFVGVCPDAGDRLVHKSEVRAFRLYASPGSGFVQVGESAYDGYSDVVNVVAATP
jgi:hypothetical protein